ncbi:ParB/RepB/Spo0J family partition protein [Rhodobacteraceae bacterium CCMM004]|nr:ParB/RepB/Spo0J family partition protein [Rhodobacteraceae bacterium CCMM004]
MAAKKGERRGLGRGLSALMADVPLAAEDGVAGAPVPLDDRVAIELLRPNPDQPRRTFKPDELEELAASIRENGIIQPLIVRPDPQADGRYEIVAGERRWRAAQMAQLHDVPILVREFSDSEVLEVAIIENIQRADLNPIDEAAGYRQLMEKFDRTQDQMAQALGKSRSHIANLLRLLKLPDEVQEMVTRGELTAGHARALITAPDPLTLAQTVVRKALSVRETERLAARAETPSKAPTPKREKDADTRALEQDLAASLGMPVTLDHRAGGESGRLVISYTSMDQLDDLCRLLSGVSS